MLRWTEDYFRKASLESARLDAELLLAHTLDLDRVGVYLAYDRPLLEDERARYRALVAARARGSPVAYLTGHKEFYGVDLRVDPRCLVPRPDTECLVDRALTLLPKDAPARVADVGTGSGAIACALAHERQQLCVIATEIDPGAADLARDNAQRLAPGRVAVVRADLLAPVADGALDLVASNPPYVRPGDPSLHRHVAAFEPAVALYGGEDGLGVYRRLLPEAARCLRPGGHAVLELGAGQADAVTRLAAAAGLEVVDVRPDLAGIPRVLTARRLDRRSGAR